MMNNKINKINKEDKDLERTLIQIRKCLKDIYSIAPPYNSVCSIETKWCQLISNLWLYKGKKFAVKQLKEYFRVAKLSLQYEVIPHELRVPWCKTDKRGVPKDVSFLTPWLYHVKLENRRFALDVLNTTRLIYLKPEIDTSSITEGSNFDTLGSSWEIFITKWVKKLPTTDLGWDDKLLGWGSTKNGPNGPAIASAHLDSTAIWSNPEFQDVFLTWAAASDQNQLAEHSWRTQDEEASKMLKHPLRLSKLSFLSEGGGKTRVIAMGDYWTQISLVTLHKAAMEALRQLRKTDGTFNHSAVTRSLLQDTKDGKKSLFSLDLSSATDRFPVKLQEDLLRAWFGPVISSAWLDLMVKRDFATPTGGKVRYAVGQPMGLLSSWAVFSLTHHAVIEYAALQEGIPAFRDYYMLGDDVVICNERVASRYLKIMKKLEVEVSIPKSFISKATDKSHLAEFAKQILLDGTNMSPIPTKLLKEAQEDSFLFPELVKKLRDIGRGLTPSQETRLCSKLYGEVPKVVALIMTAPESISGVVPWDINMLKNYYRNRGPRFAPIEGFTFQSSRYSKDVMQAWLDVRIEHLIKTQEFQTTLFMKALSGPNGPFDDIMKRLTWKGTPISPSVLKRDSLNNLEIHPLANKVQHLHWTFWSAEEDLRALKETVKSSLEDESVDLKGLKIPEFMPSVTYRSYLGFKRQEAKTRSTLLRRLHKSLEEQVIPPIE